MEPTNPPADIKVQQPPISQTQSEDQPPIKPPDIIKPKKPFITTLLVTLFMVILATALGYFIYQNYQLKKSTTQKTLVLETTTPSPTSDPTENWKTHTNTKDGFTFKYPSTWEGFSDGDSSGYFKTESNNTLNLTVTLDSAPTLTEYLQKIDKLSETAYEGYPSKQVQSTNTIQVNGINCIQREEYLRAADLTSIATYCNNKKVFVGLILIPTPGNALETDKIYYDQILSTFKFLNTNNLTPISTTYSIQVPASWNGKYVKATNEEKTCDNYNFQGQTKNYQLLSICRIGVGDWTNLQNDNSKPHIPANQELIRESGFVYYYTISLDNPYSGEEANSYSNMSKEIPSIIKTFKLLE